MHRNVLRAFSARYERYLRILRHAVGDTGLEPVTSSLSANLTQNLTSRVGDTGLEPVTSSLSVTRSNQLS
jgi:hypothetical protein